MLFLRLLILFVIGMSAASADRWQLIYSSDMHGELKPCGCSEKGNLGGVLRRASKLEELRGTGLDTIVVSGGDIVAGTDEQGRIKTDYILQAFSQFGMDALLPGERELAHPVSILQKSSLPWVLTNAADDLGLAMSRIKTLSDGRRVIILGVLQSGLGKLTLEDPAVAIRQELGRLNAGRKDVVILLVHGDRDFMSRLSGIKTIDVLSGGHLNSPVISVEEKAKRPYRLVAGHRGQHLGIAEFTSSGRPRMLSNKILALSPDIPDHPRLQALYKKYDEDVTSWYRNKSQQMKRGSGTNANYASHQACAKCHTQVAKSWQETRHAHAMQALQAVGKAEDPECLICHTTGMGQEGGFVNHHLTSHLVNVQCEACHGAARRHTEYPRRYRPLNGFSACKGCHTDESSPDFDMSRYWMQIAHSKSFSLPLHRQDISPLLGSYELIDEPESLVSNKETEVVEFFNFYCSRCYVLNANWKSVTKGQVKPPRHKEIPIIVGETQEPWAALAWLVARDEGLGDKVKDALFNARFELKVDLSDKQAILNVVQRFGIAKQVEQAINDTKSKAWSDYEKAQADKDRWDVHETPMVILNNKLRVSPKQSNENTNLMLENLQEILLDMQCRRIAVCEQ